jgi:hypothetical protein
MNCLRKKYHLNVDVKKRGSNLAKCIICESLKDLISKVGKNSVGAKNMKWNYRNMTFTKNHVDQFITLGELNQSNPKRSIFISSMTRWTTPKLLFPYLLWKTKWFLVWVSFPSLWLVWLFMVMKIQGFCLVL